MKIKLNIIAGLVTIAAIALGVISTTSAKANVVEGEAKKKKLIECQTNTPGGPTQFGNTCDSGSNTCYPNPCD